MAAPLYLDFPGGLIPYRLGGRAEHFISQAPVAREFRHPDTSRYVR
jgi:hypothetical protein